MNVLLVNPFSDFPSIYAPLGLAYLAGNLDSKHNVFGLDMNYVGHNKGKDTSYDYLLKILKDMEIDIVGISIMESSLDESENIAKVIRDHSINTKIITGGYLATLFPKDINFADFIIQGEAEISFNDLINQIQTSDKYAEIEVNDQNLLIQNLDCIKNPKRDIFPSPFNDLQYNVVAIMSTRGCKNKCKFCSLIKFYSGNFRKRSLENVKKELVEVTSDPKISALSINDEQFFGFNENDYNRAFQFLQLIEEVTSHKKKFKIGIEGRADHYVKFLNKFPQAENIFSNLSKMDSTEANHLLSSKNGFSISLGIESLSSNVLKYYGKGLDLKSNLTAIRKIQSAPNSYGFFILPYHAEISFNDIVEHYSNYFKYVSDIDLYHNCLFLSNLSESVIPFKGTSIRDRLDRKGLIIKKDGETGYIFSDPRAGLLYHMMNNYVHRLDSNNFDYESIKKFTNDAIKVAANATFKKPVTSLDSLLDHRYLFMK